MRTALQDMGRFATVVIDPPWPMRLAHRETVRRVAPGPRLDVYARRAIEGFVPWGDEAPA